MKTLFAIIATLLVLWSCASMVAPEDRIDENTSYMADSAETVRDEFTKTWRIDGERIRRWADLGGRPEIIYFLRTVIIDTDKGKMVAENSLYAKFDYNDYNWHWYDSAALASSGMLEGKTINTDFYVTEYGTRYWEDYIYDLPDDIMADGDTEVKIYAQKADDEIIKITQRQKEKQKAAIDLILNQ